MPFPDVLDLLEYWVEFPPSHLLLRALARYEGPKKGRGQRRKRRAEQMQDTVFAEQEQKEAKEPAAQHNYNPALLANAFKGSRHIDCAPPHIQQAIERAKKKEHLNVPK